MAINVVLSLTCSLECISNSCVKGSRIQSLYYFGFLVCHLRATNISCDARNTSVALYVLSIQNIPPISSWLGLRIDEKLVSGTIKKEQPQIRLHYASLVKVPTI